MKIVPTNPYLKDLPTYQPGRPIEEVARELNLPAHEIIKLASNENPLGPSPLALAAMQKVLANLNLYPDGNAFYLKQKLAEKLGVAPANLVLGNGSNEIIEFVGHTYFAPGVDVMVSQFCFAIYPLVTKLFGANLITVPAKNHGHDLPAMLKAITPQTRVVFVANPNNPTGTLVPREEVIQFVNAIPENVLLVMDEAYIEFLDEPLDLASLVRLGVRPNLLLMRTFSKIFGLAGLRLGYALGSAQLIEALYKIKDSYNLDRLTQAIGLAAIEDADHLRRNAEKIKATRARTTAALAQLGCTVLPSATNFLFVKPPRLPAAEVFAALRARNIIVRYFPGPLTGDYLRVTVGTDLEMDQFLAALREALD